MWKINDKEFELDLTEAETVERYHKSLKILEKMPKPTKKTLTKDYILSYCKTFREFYDEIFGFPISEQLFVGVPESILKYNQIYESFLEFVKNQPTGLEALQQFTK